MGIFEPGRNAWRVERAERAAILIDACTYFGAVREALLQAQRCVFIVGWDLDSRTALVPGLAPARWTEPHWDDGVRARFEERP